EGLITCPVTERVISRKNSVNTLFLFMIHKVLSGYRIYCTSLFSLKKLKEKQ
ncbi:MAG: hypothetical protein ACJATF_003669, partial [Flavobacteriales bacterium]